MSNGGHSMCEKLGKPKNDLDAALRADYLASVEDCDAELTKRNKFTYRSYAEYEQEVHGEEIAAREALIAQHGQPKTYDGTEILIGLPVFIVKDSNGSYSDSPAEYMVVEDRIENFDFIFNHWMVKLERHGFNPDNRIYATRLAATNRAVELYRGEIAEIEAKIRGLQE